LADNKTAPVTTVENAQTAEHIKRIWEILKDTPGFDPMQLVPVIPQLLSKPETQQMGQQIAGGLAQRVLVRMIRETLLKETPQEAPSNGRKTAPAPKLVLPQAAIVQ
jgi:hypothetical protein